MIHWLRSLPQGSLNILFILIGGACGLGLVSDFWEALQVDDDKEEQQ